MTDSSLLDTALIRVAQGRATARIEEGRASIIVDVSGLDDAARDALEADVRAAASDVPGISSVRVALTSQRSRRIVLAVASGKGGVGKSTVSANLAIALARSGRRVGLVDADIYGPSQPRLMGVADAKPTARDKVLQPVPTPYGVPMLSMGMLVAADQAIAWRGPMAAGALTQMMDANWGPADTLVLDLPPGTGDVQLTMIQKYRPSGAVIVSTPQDLALIDARRAIDLFVKAGVPIIGLIENMAGYVCPSCGEISDPFGTGGAEAAAAELGLPFLGRIPLDIRVRVASDAGQPPAAGNGPEGVAFMGVADKVGDWIKGQG
ncbi:ATP-binding protein involved in chromosome partitioning [Sphingomonas sp. BE270]|jgi:ATP-binding protein involved in chromosome partitioning|uniref:Mrp/NBP35 family ATP-binding protein n=2 Tax=Sphingomonas TaxID=13687 RepID=UPI001AE5AC78|nr:MULTISPECIES: P-loop NTPase [unclassified Sphingomonas]MDR6850258.1 ATP-binding protein involved in chromosome partitioning [Sphingomonas sp. BE137]MDR7257192.1 ATP-binding protein involved in chromosome partitioning [Sphingomonas sp. BE270]